jgi:hypothetical protein
MFTTVALVTLHLLGVGAVVGVVFATLVLVHQSLTNTAHLPLLRALRLVGACGGGVAILTGITMAYRYGISVRSNWWFDAKLLLVAADGLIAERVIKHQIDSALKSGQSSNLRQKLLSWAWLSVVIVIAIVAISAYRGKTHG